MENVLWSLMQKIFWPTRSDLRLNADCNDPNKPLVGWAVCQFCRAAFQTHSKIDEKGKCKNHDLTSCTKHVEHCHVKKKKMPKRNKENSSLDSFTTDPQPSVSQFLTTKKKMTSSWLNK